jgi:16S rRNA (cytosine967-C5)-methyltransferase
MSRFHSYLNIAEKILASYKATAPFNIHIKEYFAANKKHGSRDRKLISSLCYDYFRTAKAFSQKTIQEQLQLGWFLCEETDPGFLEDDLLKTAINKTVEKKLTLSGKQPEDLFPFVSQLSEKIPPDAFAVSMLQQPDLFIRIRPGKEKLVKEKLQKAGIDFTEENNNALRLKNASAVNQAIEPDKEAVIQDLNSQQVFNRLNDHGKAISQHPPCVWDCCAASGGKSILIYDQLKGKLKLNVSDIRPPILANLEKRLQKARVPLNRTSVIDLEKSSPLENENYDLIICDAPCTGSGTWSRTPEQLFYFKQKTITEYTKRQKAIALNASKQLKPGGLFIYITCSVFKSENEDIAALLSNELQLVHQYYLEGWGAKADTMFVAIFEGRKAINDK